MLLAVALVETANSKVNKVIANSEVSGLTLNLHQAK